MLQFIIELLFTLIKVNVLLVQSLFRTIWPEPRKDVSKKTILITGSAHGIGKEMAILFHKLRANLALVDVNENLNNELVSELKLKNTSKVFGYKCDITNEQDIEKLYAKVTEDLGPVDILINNAGIVKCQSLDKLKSQDIRNTFNVNVFSHFWMNRQFLPSMIARKSGQIVATSSIAGLTGTANLVDYCSSKFAVNGMMEALEYELQSKGYDFINLTTICPLAISTGMFKSPKTKYSSLFPILTPSYTAETAVDAILRNKTLLTIPGYAYWTLFLVSKILPPSVVTVIRNFADYGVNEHKD